MYQDLKKHFWWNGMKSDITDFVRRCMTFQKVKAEHQNLGGTLQPLPIPTWKWDQVTMDHLTGLPKIRCGYDSIWVIVDILTKSAHFLPVKKTDNVDKLAQLYHKEIVRIHRVPASIISNTDPKFTLQLWQSLHRCLGTKLQLSTIEQLSPT